jgi:hypothetical protein
MGRDILSTEVNRQPMPGQPSHLQLDRPASYRIQVQGRLDPAWADWLDVSSLQVSEDSPGAPVTTFTASVTDQAALHGWLARLRDLGLSLLSLEYLGPAE